MICFIDATVFDNVVNDIVEHSGNVKKLEQVFSDGILRLS